MKRISMIALFFLLLAGCVASDPAINIVNEQALIGTWNLSSYTISGKKTIPKNRDELKLIFLENNDITIALYNKSIPEMEKYKGIKTKYSINGKELSILIFKDNKYTGSFIGTFQFSGSNILSIGNLKGKSALLGKINYCALFPDINFREIKISFLKKHN